MLNQASPGITSDQVQHCLLILARTCDQEARGVRYLSEAAAGWKACLVMYSSITMTTCLAITDLFFQRTMENQDWTGQIPNLIKRNGKKFCLNNTISTFFQKIIQIGLGPGLGFFRP